MCVSVCAYVQGAEGQIRKCQSPHTLSQSFFLAEAILSLNTQKEGSTKDFLSQSTAFLKAIFSRNLKLWDVAHSNSCDNRTIHKSPLIHAQAHSASAGVRRMLMRVGNTVGESPLSAGCSLI